MIWEVIVIKSSLLPEQLSRGSRSGHHNKPGLALKGLYVLDIV